jgi:toxin ParE1/3/4
MDIFWTDNARTHLRGIYNHIALHSEQYAKKNIDRITKRAKQIVNFPLSGRKVAKFDIDQIREIIEKPYRIIYYIRPDNIEILAVVHSSQNIMQVEEQ